MEIHDIREGGLGILFCGDLETAGWEYLLRNNPSFTRILRDQGVDVLIAPHHGHKSGFPKALFDVIGKVKLVIHSKDTEASKAKSDIATQYNEWSLGHWFENLHDRKMYRANVLTTRSNGHIFLSSVDDDFYVVTQTASPNNQEIK